MFSLVSALFCLALGIAFLIALVGGIGAYNELVAARDRVRSALLEMDEKFQARQALLPQLVDTAKVHMRHERETLEAVVAAWKNMASALQSLAAAPADAALVQHMLQMERSMESVLARLYSLAEAYPEFQADPNTGRITRELAAVEERIVAARRDYNAAVGAYNGRRESLPVVLWAGMFGFEPAVSFESVEHVAPEKPVADLR